MLLNLLSILFLSVFVLESGIFGVPLQNLVQEDKMRNEKTAVPSFYVEVR